jgi:hypothetical protein
VGKSDNGVSGSTGTLALSPTGHWDIDELLALMEWTRERVGAGGLIIVHNTMAPLFATENFADYVVGMEWGYGVLSRSVPPVTDLPPEWQFAGARSRGVIGYGTIAESAPKRLHAVMAITALLTGVTPWPAGANAIDFYRILAPLGDITQYRFEDWRNRSVHISDPECISAVYSRAGESWILLGNVAPEPKQVSVTLAPNRLPYPLAAVSAASVVSGNTPVSLLPANLTGVGATVPLPGDGVILLRVK